MLFIFDWDGTLSDSTAKIVSCMQQAGDSLLLPSLTNTAVQDIIGLGLPEAIRALYPDLEDDGVVAMREAYARFFIAADTVPSNFFPNVESTLAVILDQGHQIAVATGKSRAGLNRVLSSLLLDDFFHASRCADETASKPHPKMLHELVEELGSCVDDAIMVGDTEFDMEMARRAGMRKVAVDYGAHHVSRLQPYDPLMCVSDFKDILRLI